MNESFRVEKLKEDVERLTVENDAILHQLKDYERMAKENEELLLMVNKLTSEKEMLKECIVKLTMEKHGVY